MATEGYKNFAKSKKVTGNSPISDKIYAGAVQSETNCRLRWDAQYSWMPAEYIKIQNELIEVCKLKPQQHGPPPEHRSAKPVPITSSGFYGWLAGRREFQLDIYGSDIMHIIPFAKEDLTKDDD